MKSVLIHVFVSLRLLVSLRLIRGQKESAYSYRMNHKNGIG